MNAERPGSSAPAPRDGDFGSQPAMRSVVARARRPQQLSEARLVLRALGIPHAVLTERGAALLVVPAREALRAQAELEAYARENRTSVDARPRPRAVTRGALGAAIASAVLIVCHLRFGTGGPRQAGILDGALVASGEWWRLVTALTLHADAPHLAGNVVFGAIFGVLLAQQVGNGVAWLAILLGGGLGNGLNVLVRAVPHRALGASTAVFAALGLLVVLALRWRRGEPGANAMRRWAPLVAGMGLLGWLGTGGESTDIPAHLFGLLAGMLVGLPLRGLAGVAPATAPVQLACGALALALTAAAWVAAFTWG